MQTQAPLSFPQKQTIFLSGALNAAAMENIRQIFDTMAVSQVDEVVIDLSKVKVMDASGVGALVFLFKRLKNAERSMKITGAHGQPEAIIRLLRMEKAIDTQFLN